MEDDKDIKNWRELQELNNRRQLDIDEEEEEDIEIETPEEVAYTPDEFYKMFPEYLPRSASSSVAAINSEAASRDPDVTDLAVAADYGASHNDYKAGLREFVKDPVNIRANAQSQGEKVVNGLLKMPIYAASTYVDNTAGLIDSFLEVGYDAINGGEFHPLQSGINTYTAEAMQKWRDWSEKALPNYRTEEEMNDQEHWYKHLNGNFWGDVILKNLGFTLGAGLSGKTLARLGSLVRGKKVSDMFKGTLVASGETTAEEGTAVRQGLRTNPGRVWDNWANKARQLKNAGIENQLVGGIGAALGEARMEAMMAAQEFHDPQVEKINAEYSQAYDNIIEDIFDNEPELYTIDPITGERILTPDGEAEALKRAQRMNDTRLDRLAQVETEAARVANTVFALNMPLLTADNIIQFGRYFAGGYKTQLRGRTKGVMGDLKGRGSVAKAVTKGFLNAYSEGQEELLQKIFSEGAKDIADNNMAAFHNKQYDEYAIRDVGEWLTSMVNTAGNVVVDTSSWQEFAAGFLTGAIGIPGVGKGKHIVKDWHGGIVGGVMEELNDMRRNKELADTANKVYKDPKLHTIMKGLVRHQYDERIKEEALDNQDSYTWHTANDEQLINAVMTFAEIGRLDELEDMADGFANVSDKDITKLKSLVEGEDALDPEWRNKSNKEVLDFFHKRAEEVKKSIEQYRDFYETVDSFAGGPKPGETREQYQERLKEIIFTKSQLQNFEDRYNTLMDKVIKEVRPAIEQKAKEVDAQKEPTKEAKQAQTILANEDNVRMLFGGLGNRADTFTMIDDARQKVVLDTLKKWGNYTDDSTVVKDIQDLQKLVKSRQLFYSKLYDPSQIGQSINDTFNDDAVKPETVAENLSQSAIEEKAREGFEGLKNVKSIKEFDAYLGTFSDTNGVEAYSKLLQMINDSDNATLKGYKKALDDLASYIDTTRKRLSMVKENKPAAEAKVITRVQELFEKAVEPAYTKEEANKYLLAYAEEESQPVKDYIQSMVTASATNDQQASGLGGKPAKEPEEAQPVAVPREYNKLSKLSQNPKFSEQSFRSVWDTLSEGQQKWLADRIEKGPNALLKKTLAAVRNAVDLSTVEGIRTAMGKIADPKNANLIAWSQGKFGSAVLTDEDKENLAYEARQQIDILRKKLGLIAGPPKADSNFDDKGKEEERKLTEAQKEAEKQRESALSGDLLPVYKTSDLILGAMTPYDPTDNSRAGKTRDWMRQHKAQEFIDSGALIHLRKEYLKRTGKELPVYFLNNPISGEDNPFSYKSENGKDLRTMVLAVEIEEADRKMLKPYFEEGFVSEDSFVTIPDSKGVDHVYQVIGLGKKEDINKDKYNKLYRQTIVTGIITNQSPKESRMYVAQKRNGERMSTTLNFVYSGRNITRESVEEDTKKVPLSEALKTYKKINGNYGFALMILDKGQRTVLASNPYVPAMPMGMNPALGSLWVVTDGPDGRTHWTYVNILRLDEYDFTTDNISPYAKRLLDSIESLFDNNKRFEDLLVTAHGIYDQVYFGEGGGLRFHTVEGKRVVSVNGTACYSPEEVLQAMQKDRLRFQVSAADINDNARMSTLVDSGVLYSDMTSFIRRGASFGINFLDDAGNPIQSTFVDRTPGVSRNWQPTEDTKSVNIQVNTNGNLRGYKVMDNGQVRTMDTDQVVTDKYTSAVVRSIAMLKEADGSINQIREGGGHMWVSDRAPGYTEMFAVFDQITGLQVYAKRVGLNGAIVPATREEVDAFSTSEGVEYVWTEEEQQVAKEENVATGAQEEKAVPEEKQSAAPVKDWDDFSGDAEEPGYNPNEKSVEESQKEEDELTVKQECGWDDIPL